MVQFPPIGGDEAATRGGVAPKVQTTSVKNAENRGVVGEVDCVLGKKVSDRGCQSVCVRGLIYKYAVNLSG